VSTIFILLSFFSVPALERLIVTEKRLMSIIDTLSIAAGGCVPPLASFLQVNINRFGVAEAGTVILARCHVEELLYLAKGFNNIDPAVGVTVAFTRYTRK
jgi:hypothetical protein